MKRKLLISLGVLLAVLVVVVLILPLVFNADRFRPMVEQRMEAALGRRVQIGKLKLSVLAGGITAEQVSVADDPVFSQSAFLRTRAVELGTEWWPLISSGTLRVNSLTVREPELVLIQSARGKWNFESIAHNGSRPTTAPKTAESAPPLSIQKIRIEKAIIVVRRPAATQTYSDVNLEARDVSFTSSFPFTLKALMPGNGKLQVEGKAGPVPPADPSQVPVQASYQIEGLDLGNSGYFGHPSPVDGVTAVKGTASSDGRVVHAEANTQVKGLRLVNGGAPTHDPVALDVATEYDLNRQSGRITRGELHPRASAKSVIRLGGTYDARGSSALVRMDMNGDKLPTGDVANLLPALAIALPGGTSLQGGTVSANLALNGPVDRLVVSGPLRVSDVTIKGFDLGSKLSTVGALAGIQSGPDTRIQRLNTRLQVTPDATRFDNVDAAIEGMGDLAGAGTIAANHALDFHLVAKLARGGGLLGGLMKASGVGQLSNVAFAIQGTTTNPVFVPDVNSILAQKQRAGQTTQPQQQPQQGNPLSNFMGIFKKK